MTSLYDHTQGLRIEYCFPREKTDCNRIVIYTTQGEIEINRMAKPLGTQKWLIIAPKNLSYHPHQHWMLCTPPPSVDTLKEFVDNRVTIKK